MQEYDDDTLASRFDWRAWARRRGAHYYSVREPWESAKGCAPCVSDDPDLQRAFVEGWREAEMSDHA